MCKFFFFRTNYQQRRLLFRIEAREQMVGVIDAILLGYYSTTAMNIQFQTKKNSVSEDGAHTD